MARNYRQIGRTAAAKGPQDSWITKSVVIKYCLAGMVALATLVLYLPALRNGFVTLDDSVYVVENVHIRTMNVAFLKWALTDLSIVYWMPVTWISHALDYAIWGLKPFGHHLTNVVLHAVNTYLVVLLVIRLVRWQTVRLAVQHDSTAPAALFFEDHSRTTLIAAGVTGALFGLHPLHVESVAWIAERKDLLCALFYLLSIVSYTSYVQSVSNEDRAGCTNIFIKKKPYIFSMFFFILALASKPMAVSLPVVLLLLDWYPFRRVLSSKRLYPVLAEKLPFITMSLLVSFATIVAQKNVGAMVLMDLVTLSARILSAIRSAELYIGKMIVPTNLLPLYPYPTDISLLTPLFLAAIVLFSMITAACIITAGRTPLWMAVWAYYLVTLLPVAGLVQVGLQPMADRFTYLPSIGPLLLAGLAAAALWERVNVLKWLRSAAMVFVLVFAIALCITLSALTMRQIGIWKNDVALWSTVIRGAPASSVAALAHLNIGTAYAMEGRLEDASEAFGAALRISPDYAEAHNNIGSIYLRQGRLAEAAAEFKIAMRLHPGHAEEHSNLGSVYLREGRTAEAITEYELAISINRDHAEAHNNLGIAYQRQNRLAEAIVEYETALRLNPDLSEAKVNHDKACALRDQSFSTGNALKQYFNLNPAGPRKEGITKGE